MVWCDWGRAMEIGAETCAPEIAHVTFADCDIVRTTHIAMDIQHGDRAVIHDIRFERVRVEIDDQNPPPQMQQNRDEKYTGDMESGYCPTLLEIIIRKNFYSQDEERGTVHDIMFQDITVLSRLQPPSSFRGLDAEHDVQGVTIQNLKFNDQLIRDAAAARLTIGPHVQGVQFTATTANGRQ